MTHWIVVFYIAFFVAFALHSKHYHWLAGALFLWVGFILIGTRPLSWFYSSQVFLHLPYLMIVLSSFFFFVQDWHYHSQKKCFYSNASFALTFFAIAGLLQHLAFLIITLISSLMSNNFIAQHVYHTQMTLYFLQPVWWIVVHFVLMGFFWTFCRYRIEPLIRIRWDDLGTVFLMALSINLLTDLVFLLDFSARWS